MCVRALSMPRKYPKRSIFHSVLCPFFLPPSAPLNIPRCFTSPEYAVTIIRHAVGPEEWRRSRLGTIDPRLRINLSSRPQAATGAPKIPRDRPSIAVAVACPGLPRLYIPTSPRCKNSTTLSHVKATSRSMKPTGFSTFRLKSKFSERPYVRAAGVPYP